MEINFNYNNLEEAPSLAPMAEQKLATLQKFLKRADSVACTAKFSKVAPQQNGQIHQFEVSLIIDGESYRAEATEESFEKAIDEVRDELDKELRRAKDRKDTLAKKAGRALKGLISR